MAGKNSLTGRSMTVREASLYWDAHSVADHPSRVVKFEYSPDEGTAKVAIAGNLLPRLIKQARRQGISVETLLNLWIQEKVSA